MAWTVDQASLGSPTVDGSYGASPAGFTTSQAIAAGAWIVLDYIWVFSANLSSINDGGLGLTWQIVQNGGSGERSAIAVAYCPNAQTSGKTFTPVMSSGDHGGRKLGGRSFLGGDASSYDTGVSNGATGTALSSGNITTAADNELVVMAAGNGGPANEAPSGGASESYEDSDANSRVLSALYKVAGAAGTQTVTGTYGFSVDWSSSTIALKESSGPAPSYPSIAPDFARTDLFPFAPGSDDIIGRGRPGRIGAGALMRGTGPGPYGGFERSLFVRLHPVFPTAQAPFDLPTASETDVAQALTFAKAFGLPIATETDTAIALAFAKAFALPVATETDVAQALAFSKALSLPVATETDTAQTLSFAKAFALPIATETDVAQALAFAKAFVLPFASETDTAQALIVATAGGQSFTIPVATESDVAQALAFSKAFSLVVATETDTAQQVVFLKTLTLPVATEADVAQAYTFAKAFSLPIGLEVDNAQALIFTGGGGGPVVTFHRDIRPRALRAGMYSHLTRRGHGSNG